MLATLSRQTAICNEQVPSTRLRFSARENVAERINHELTEIERTSVRNLLDDFTSLFPQNDEPPGQTQLITHKIDTGTHGPVRCKYNKRYAPIEKKIIASEIKKMVIHGVVRPWSVRFCVDFRELNKITKRDTYPQPRMDDVRLFAWLEILFVARIQFRLLSVSGR